MLPGLGACSQALDRQCVQRLTSAESHVPCVLQEMMHDEEDAASAGGKPRPQDRVRQWLGLGGRRKAESAQGAVDPSNPEAVKVGCRAHPEQGRWAVLGWHPYTTQQPSARNAHAGSKKSSMSALLSRAWQALRA